MSQKMTRQTRPYNEFDGKIAGFISIQKLDFALITVMMLFIIAVVALAVLSGNTTAYAMLHLVHYHLSRYSLFMATVMFVLALYIGLRKHADVTPYFRRGVYVIVGTMVVESLAGLVMFLFANVRPAEDIHLIYGMATILCLPFFIFVETTAEKRPSMGSYMWGFAILAGIIFRCISTGAA